MFSPALHKLALVMQVNRIRLSLKAIAKNSTAFGLRQPHLERTRLCELAESELEKRYVTQRNDLRQVNGREKSIFIGSDLMGELIEISEKLAAYKNMNRLGFNDAQIVFAT